MIGFNQCIKDKSSGSGVGGDLQFFRLLMFDGDENWVVVVFSKILGVSLEVGGNETKNRPHRDV